MESKGLQVRRQHAAQHIAALGQTVCRAATPHAVCGLEQKLRPAPQRPESAHRVEQRIHPGLCLRAAGLEGRLEALGGALGVAADLGLDLGHLGGLGHGLALCGCSEGVAREGMPNMAGECSAEAEAAPEAGQSGQLVA